MSFDPGTLLGHYRVRGLLGRGGMADVYRAVDERLGREVALKALPPAFARDPSRVRRFEREVRAAAGLTHPGIVTVYEYGSGGGHHFFTMTLMPGGDLKTRIRANPRGIPEDEAREVTIAVASALDYAHTHGFVHRDVTPENVMFGHDGRPQLADFGIARTVSDGSWTEEGMVIGKPQYVSPEQARAGRVDGRSDLYSLGVVLYEMLTGRVPFEAADSMAVLYAHVNEPAPALPPAVAGWQPTLDRLLAKAPEARYQTAGELLAELAPEGSWTGPRRAARPVSAEAGPAAAPEGVPVDSEIAEGGTRVVAAAQAGRESGTGAGPSAQRTAAEEVQDEGSAARNVPSWMAAIAEPKRRGVVFGTAGAAAMAVIVAVVWAGAVAPSDPEDGTDGATRSAGAVRTPGPAPQPALAETGSQLLKETGGVLDSDADALATAPEALPAAGSSDVFGVFGNGIVESASLDDGERIAGLEVPGAVSARPDSTALATAVAPAPGPTAALESPPRAPAPAAPDVVLPPAGILRFEITPPDATVVLEAENRRLSSGDTLRAGTHRLKIGREGYREIVRAVRVAEGDVVPVRVELERVPEPTLLDSMRGAVAEVPRRPPRTPAEPPAAGERPPEPPQVAREAVAREPDSAELTDRLRSGGTGPAMVVVPAGEFRMGCLEDEGGCRNEELPVRTVRVLSFALARHEVTRGDFARFQKATGRDMGGGCRVFNGRRWINERERTWRDPGFNQIDSDPVVCINWEDAADYAVWLSRETGERYRLPSEAEWEYAARAESVGRYSWGDAAGRGRANCNGCAGGGDGNGTSRAGSFQANGWGLFDMHGNAWEWTADCWSFSYKNAPTDGSAVQPRRCKERVMRGGSWVNRPASMTSSYRHRIFREDRYNNVGFRVAREVSE